MRILVLRCIFDVQIERALGREWIFIKMQIESAILKIPNMSQNMKNWDAFFLQYSCNDAISKVLQACTHGQTFKLKKQTKVGQQQQHDKQSLVSQHMETLNML